VTGDRSNNAGADRPGDVTGDRSNNAGADRSGDTAGDRSNNAGADRSGDAAGDRLRDAWDIRPGGAGDDRLGAAEGGRRVVWLPVVAILLAVACLGGSGYSLYRLLATGDRTPIPFAEPTFGAPSGAAATAHSSSSPSYDPSVSYATITDVDTLSKVCDHMHYPKSPPFAGGAPHPIALSAKKRLDLPSRLHETLYEHPSWELKDPAAAQLVACLDLVESGEYVQSCKFDDPKPDSLPLKKGVYQLTLYEVASGRTVFERRLTGADDACPYVVLIGADRTLFTDVSERQLYDALRRYVEQ
jgi:hypothetical protein